MYLLYGNPASRTLRCLWALEELGVPYELKPLDFSKQENRSEEYLALNPSGKVPTLKHGDYVLWESGAICSYLAENHPEKRMIPPQGTKERGLYYQWMSFVASELEQGLWSIGKHRFALPESKRIEKMQEIGAYEFGVAAAIFAKELGKKKFLVGDTFTMADIMATHTLGWAKKWELPVEGVLRDYLKEHQSRSAFRKLIEKYF